MNSASSFSKWSKFVVVGLLIALGSMWFLEKGEKIEPSPDAWFQSEVASEARPVLVKFGAEWCGPCRVMDDSIDQVAPNLDSQVKFVRVDVDQNRGLASHYRVTSIPRTFLFHHGQIIAEQKGSLDADGLKSWIQSSLAKVPKSS